MADRLPPGGGVLLAGAVGSILTAAALLAAGVLGWRAALIIYLALWLALLAALYIYGGRT